MVNFDFFKRKSASTLFFSTIEWHKVTRTKNICATSINKSIASGERGRWHCYASKRILLTLPNILVCESLLFLDDPQVSHPLLIQTEAERRRREAGVKQSMEIRVRSCMYACMYVCMYVWYLEFYREPRHVAQQTRYQNVGLRNGHCLGTISSECDFQRERGARKCQNSSAQSKNAREYWQQPTLSSEDGQLAKTANGIVPD